MERSLQLQDGPCQIADAPLITLRPRLHVMFETELGATNGPVGSMILHWWQLVEDILGSWLVHLIFMS